MSVTDGLKYETFVRCAFGINSDSPVERGGDLAGLAEADIFSGAGNLPRAKIGAAYAVAIYNRHILNNGDIEIADNDYQRMVDIFDEIVTSTTLSELIQLVDEYTDLRKRYHTFSWQED